MRNSCLNYDNNYLSFITEFTERFEIILDLDISFKAYAYLFFLYSTFQTFPKPPFPIQK